MAAMIGFVGAGHYLTAQAMPAATDVGGLVLDVLVPEYVPFGQRTVYLPLIKR